MKHHFDQATHVGYARSILQVIKETYYGITESYIKLFLSLCPVCSDAAQGRIIAKHQPLLMILTTTIGERAQMDLIDMTSSPDQTTGHT